MKPEPKTLIFDIETSLDLIAAYGLRERRHHPSSIWQDWFIICFCWKWLGGSRIYNFSLIDDMKVYRKNPHDDLAVVTRLHELLSEAEVIVGHNVAAFDWKKFMARAVYHNLKPIPKPLMVDTLKQARKIASFTSNTMGYLSKYLNIENKMSHSPDMWMRILRGEAAAVREAVEYCRGDIATTEALYLRLRPYMEAHPNHNLWRGDRVECCPNCGSTHLTVSKHRVTVTRKCTQFQCQDCGKYCSGTKSIKRAYIR